MAKSSKTPKDVTSAAVSAPTEQSNVAGTLSDSPAAKKSMKTPRKRASVPARETTSGAKPKKAAAAKKAKPVEFIISDEDIRLRAYFIAQHRALSGLTGDSATDWLEARRQLFEEASRTA